MTVSFMPNVQSVATGMRCKMNKGNYYKRKTKEFLEKEGYCCEYLEKLQRIMSGKKILHIKKDIFGADILALNSEKIIFIQVKSGKNTTGIAISKAIEEFNKYPFPAFVERWIVIWRERIKEPEIVNVNDITRK